MGEKYKRRSFFYKWRIEHFDFCWHKTGERLESPLFSIESSTKTSWRLWLYPRGEDDGEYISCYLFRTEGGPEVMDVDFQLSVSVGEQLVRPILSFEKIYSFKNNQKEGEKSFVLRRKVISRKLFWEKNCTLTIGCRIFNRNRDEFEEAECFGRTEIAMERIYGMETYEDIAELGSEVGKDIEIKSLLYGDPIISLNLANFDKTITIKIHPKRCEKIKYSVCKVTLIRNLGESAIEHLRSWVGDIKTDIWSYDSFLPKTESEEQDATSARETIFLCYDFVYSVGIEYSVNELNDYGTDLWLEDISLLESSCAKVKTKEFDCRTALESLKPCFVHKLFSDITLETKTKVFHVHKAVLHARSSELSKMLKDNPAKIEFGTDYRDDIVRRFLLFLYSDEAEEMCCQIAIDLYKLADRYKVEFLKQKCRRFLEENCDAKNISELLRLATTFEDKPLKTYFMKYIVAHDEEVFSTDEWQMFADEYWSLAEECMLLKYRKDIPN